LETNQYICAVDYWSWHSNMKTGALVVAMAMIVNLFNQNRVLTFFI